MTASTSHVLDTSQSDREGSCRLRVSPSRPSSQHCGEGGSPDLLVQPEGLHGPALREAHLRQLPQSCLVYSLILVLVQHCCGQQTTAGEGPLQSGPSPPEVLPRAPLELERLG